MKQSRSRDKELFSLKFQEIILALQKFWSEQGCILAQPYDVEKGAGTMNPSTFLRVLGPEPWNVAYVEPSRRPADGRYGDNPNRLYQHHQFQVIMKPSPDNIQELYLQSLESLGIDPKQHDIRFVEDNWESPTLGAWGLGWEVWLDGMEITQFTYFQQVGSVDVKPVSSEITYGLEPCISKARRPSLTHSGRRVILPAWFFTRTRLSSRRILSICRMKRCSLISSISTRKRLCASSSLVVSTLRMIMS